MNVAGKFFTPKAIVNLILYGTLKHRAGHIQSLQCLHERWRLRIVPGSTSRAYLLFMKDTDFASYTACCWHFAPPSLLSNFYSLDHTNPHLHITILPLDVLKSIFAGKSCDVPQFFRQSFNILPVFQLRPPL